MTGAATDGARWRRHWPVALLAFLAYVPALTAAPGRMPSDSKLYLYLDPGGFLADAASSFDPGQFAGWVPHQHVSYLWPAGPWFWLYEILGVPDWIAHRMWIGTLMLAAGMGVRWCSRRLGLTATAAVAAALVYQVSLYVLPYVSRTSVMLLPWAGLGWIVGFTVRATTRRTWGDPAAIALIVLTVGAVNATALAMIVPAPLAWLVHEVWRRTLPWRAALLVGVRVAVLSVGVSLWWIVALMIQGRYGADVLPYSESLADVSLTATSSEVWRGLGYWLFYVRDPYAATTTESLRYLSSTPALLVSFLLPVVCLVGLVWVRWVHRRFAVMLVVAGGVLAVGVHPIDDRSPLMRLVAGGDDGLALALRSSTRALPVLMLGLALAAAALVESVPARPLARLPKVRADHLAAGLVGLLVLANMPGLWTGAFVDPALERDQDPPAAWQEAAASLDDGGRVLMLPGVEFGAYRWGYTVDQPLPGLTDAPLVTRDLLPLGSPAAMDLLYAFDDRFQDGVAEPAAVGPIARLLGADTVWLTNDVAFDRFRVARPEVVRDVVLDSPDVARTTAYGAPGVNVPEVPMADGRSLADPRVGSPVTSVELVELSGSAGLVRAYDRSVLVAGSGDGLVDAAAARLLSSDVGVRYVADDPALDPSTVGQLVTDSNRDRARHWRSSQDTTGYTEPGGPGNGLLTEAVGDARLPVFETDDPANQTVAEQVGPVRATATSYGERFALLPERRPYMAVDGDPATAWTVGEHADPIGETISVRLDGGGPPTGLRVLQAPTQGRRITELRVMVADRSGTVLSDRSVVLDDTSVTTGQEVGLDADPARIARVDITITAVGGGKPFTAGAVAGVGFAELDLGLGPTEEIVRPPTPVRNAPDDLPLAYLFTRERVDPLDRWRSDPEPKLRRGWDQEAARTVSLTYTVRVDARTDDATLAELFGWPVVADRRLTGSLRNVGAAAFDGDAATAWISPFGDPSGSLVVRGVSEPVSSISVSQPIVGISEVTEVTVSAGGQQRTVPLVPDVLGIATATIDPPLPAGDVTISFAASEVATTVDRRFGDPIALPIAIGEIELDGAPSVAPLADTADTLECVEVGSLDGMPLRATLTVAGDGWLDGAAIAAVPCHQTIGLAAGPHRLDGANGVFTLDRVLLDDGLAAALGGAPDRPAVTVIAEDRFGGTYRVEGCSDGCWFVDGNGVNEGWSASVGGRDLETATLLDGGFNGWWLESGDEVVVQWGPQRTQNLAFVLTLVAVAAAITLLVRDRHHSPAAAHDSAAAPPRWAWHRIPTDRPTWVVAAAWAVPALMLAGPWWGLLGAAGGLLTARFRRVPIAALSALAAVGVIGLAVAILERRDAPFPGGGWPTTFESLHWVGMFAFAALAASALTDDA